MEDRYLFKAKRFDNGKWIMGFLTVMRRQLHIINPYNENAAYPIDNNTICQCTGRKDKNGNLIWENDIARTIFNGIEHIYRVIWDESELDFKATNGKEFYKSNFEYLSCCDEVEIIGNVFDNQELLESDE